MKTDAILLSMFGVYVNFRVRNLQRPAVQLCGKMDGEGVKNSYYNLLPAAASAVITADLLCYQITQADRACIADLDSGALALTKKVPGNSHDSQSLILHYSMIKTSCLPALVTRANLVIKTGEKV